jgi:hypothetical protein
VDVTLTSSNGSSLSVTWELVYRASLFGFGAREFHQACDGQGKNVVTEVVRADNGRIAVAYNEDGFQNHYIDSPNRNEFIVSIYEDGNLRSSGSVFWIDLKISNNCNRNEESSSRLG